MKKPGGTNFKRVRMRCTKGGCRCRFTLKKHPTEYVKPVRCPRCRAVLDGVGVDERNRRAEQLREDTCRCSAYPFPHKSGSLRACVGHPLAGVVDMTDEEYENYQRVIETPRAMEN